MSLSRSYASLRVGVGDASGNASDTLDWALFMPIAGNGDGDFSNSTWVFGGEGMANNGYAGEVTIKGESPLCFQSTFT